MLSSLVLLLLLLFACVVISVGNDVIVSAGAVVVGVVLVVAAAANAAVAFSPALPASWPLLWTQASVFQSSPASRLWAQASASQSTMVSRCLCSPLPEAPALRIHWHPTMAPASWTLLWALASKSQGATTRSHWVGGSGGLIYQPSSDSSLATSLATAEPSLALSPPTRPSRASALPASSTSRATKAFSRRPMHSS